MEDKEDTKKRAPCAEKLTDGCSENSKDRKREREREVNRAQFVQRASQNTCVDGLLVCVCACVWGGVLKA